MLFLFHKYFVILRTETNKAKYMMKTRSLFTILFCCVAAVCVTSCINNDDDDNSSQALTKAEIAQCYMTVGGNYTGDLFYLTTSADGMTENIDTLVGKEYTLHYEDGDHLVRVVFYINNIYSFGTFDATSRELMLKIIPGALYVDGKETSYFTPSQIVFVAKKSNG